MLHGPALWQAIWKNYSFQFSLISIQQVALIFLKIFGSVRPRGHEWTKSFALLNYHENDVLGVSLGD